jgi:hypothetical protein
MSCSTKLSGNNQPDLNAEMHHVRFQVLKAMGMKMTAFWNGASCKLAETD